MRWWPAARAAATIFTASGAFAKGFSTSTCLPCLDSRDTPFQMRGRRQGAARGPRRLAPRARHNYRRPRGSSAARRSPAPASGSREPTATTSAPSNALAGSHDAAGSDAGRAQDSDAYHGRRVSHECCRCGTLSRKEGVNVTRAVLIGASGRMGAITGANRRRNIGQCIESPPSVRRAASPPVATSAKSPACNRSACASQPNYRRTCGRAGRDRLLTARTQPARVERLRRARPRADRDRHHGHGMRRPERVAGARHRGARRA